MPRRKVTFKISWNEVENSNRTKFMHACFTYCPWDVKIWCMFKFKDHTNLMAQQKVSHRMWILINYVLTTESVIILIPKNKMRRLKMQIASSYAQNETTCHHGGLVKYSLCFKVLVIWFILIFQIFLIHFTVKYIVIWFKLIWNAIFF